MYSAECRQDIKPRGQSENRTSRGVMFLVFLYAFRYFSLCFITFPCVSSLFLAFRDFSLRFATFPCCGFQRSAASRLSESKSINLFPLYRSVPFSDKLQPLQISSDTSNVITPSGVRKVTVYLYSVRGGADFFITSIANVCLSVTVAETLFSATLRFLIKPTKNPTAITAAKTVNTVLTATPKAFPIILTPIPHKSGYIQDRHAKTKKGFRLYAPRRHGIYKPKSSLFLKYSAAAFSKPL